MREKCSAIKKAAKEHHQQFALHMKEYLEALRKGRISVCSPYAGEVPDMEEIDHALLLIAADVQKGKEVQAALVRLKDGTYGICEQCLERIPDNRLKAQPFALQCRECQELTEDVQRERAQANLSPWQPPAFA